MFLELYFTVSATPCMTEVYYILMQSIVVQLQVTVYHDTQYSTLVKEQCNRQQSFGRLVRRHKHKAQEDRAKVPLLPFHSAS